MLRKRDVGGSSSRNNQAIRTPAALQEPEKENKKSFILLIFGVIIFIVIIPYFVQKKINKYPFGMNNIFKYDITYERLINHPTKSLWRPVSLFFRRTALETRYPYKADSSGKCIKRENYFIELLRLFGIDPYHYDVKYNDHVLVFGNETEIGAKFVEKLQTNVIGVGCDEYLDFGNQKMQLLLSHMNISYAYVACKQNIPKKANANTHTSLRIRYMEYLSNIFTVLNKYHIKYTFIHTLPHDSKIMELSKSFNPDHIVIVPELLSDRNIYAQAVKECMQEHRTITEVSNYNSPSNYKASRVAKYIIEHLDSLPKIAYIEEQFNYRPEKTIDDSVKHVYPCNVTVINSMRVSQNVIEGRMLPVKTSSNAIPKFVSSLRSIKKQNSDKPYISIIVTTNENTVESTFTRFIRSVEEGIDLYPLSDIELIIVENGKPIHNSLHLSQSLIKRTRVLQVEKMDKNCNVENVIRNRASEKAKGQFLLFVNPNVILSPSIFMFISKQVFNPGIFYTAPVYSGSFDILDSFDKRMLDSQDTANQIGLTQIGNVTNGLLFVDSVESLLKAMETSVPYFLLVSADLFKASGMFYPSEDSTSKDIFIQALRLMPGFATYSLPYGIAIEVRIGEKEKNETYSIMDQLENVVCTGDFPGTIKTKPGNTQVKFVEIKKF